MKTKVTRIYCISMLLFMTLFICAACGIKNSENNTYMDLSKYFNIEDIGGNTSCAIVIDNNIMGLGIIKGEDGIYIPYDIVRSKINKKFYVDDIENLVIYTTPDEIIDSEIGSTSYEKNSVKQSFEKATSIKVDDVVYISFDYCLLMSNNVKYEIAENPNRLVICTTLNNTLIEVNDDGKLRYEPDSMSEILLDIKKGETLYFVDDAGEYSKVANKTGITGYVKNEILGDRTEKFIELYYESMVYEHTVRDYKICLGWHQLGSSADNGSLNDLVSETKGLNVVSPTWYQISDANGNFTSLSSKSYVDMAHSMGMEVWGLISDFNYDDENNIYYINEVLSKTSSRRELISNLLLEVSATGMDGINIDFEKISSTYGEAYIQFIRELSIECRERNIVLSVDMYVPIASNMYYDRTSVGEAADYVIVMGYDEHWAGCGQAGSTASINFVTSGITDTLMEVEASRVINAIPFYTRIWSETPEELSDEDDEIIEDSIFGNYSLDSFAVGMGTAKRYVNEHSANIVWLEDLGQYYAEYKEEGITYRIWLEEQESIRKKIEVMKEYNLGGVACWKLGLEINDIWEIIDEYVNGQ